MQDIGIIPLPIPIHRNVVLLHIFRQLVSMADQRFQYPLVHFPLLQVVNNGMPETVEVFASLRQSYLWSKQAEPPRCSFRPPAVFGNRQIVEQGVCLLP